jgi:hypothetical protein
MQVAIVQIDQFSKSMHPLLENERPMMRCCSIDDMHASAAGSLQNERCVSVGHASNVWNLGSLLPLSDTRPYQAQDLGGVAILIASALDREHLCGAVRGAAPAF